MMKLLLLRFILLFFGFAFVLAFAAFPPAPAPAPAAAHHLMVVDLAVVVLMQRGAAIVGVLHASAMVVVGVAALRFLSFGGDKSANLFAWHSQLDILGLSKRTRRSIVGIVNTHFTLHPAAAVFEVI
jgi:hypothetical protein